MPRSLIWIPTCLNEFPNLCFKFPYHLIGQLNNGIFNGPIKAYTEILEHSQGAQSRNFGVGSQMDLTRGLSLSVVQAEINHEPLLNSRNVDCVVTSDKNDQGTQADHRTKLFSFGVYGLDFLMPSGLQNNIPDIFPKLNVPSLTVISRKMSHVRLLSV